MSEQEKTRVFEDMTNDLALFEQIVSEQVKGGKLIAGTVLIASGVSPELSTTRLLPFMHTPIKGKEDVPQFFAVACLTRDLILTLVSLNRKFALGLDAALELLAMTHPMVQQALEGGNVECSDVQAGEKPKKVIRDIVEVGAGAAGGNA